jgi:hypothetical protein
MRLIQHLVKTLRDSAIFNPEVQVTPSCILWPDKGIATTLAEDFLHQLLAMSRHPYRLGLFAG